MHDQECRMKRTASVILQQNMPSVTTSAYGSDPMLLELLLWRLHLSARHLC